jgi:hypothetical protein
MFEKQIDGGVVAITDEGGRLFIAVPWEKIENLRSFLARGGVNTTEHLEPSTHTARLEVWEGTNAQHLQDLVAGWEPGRLVVAL